MPSEERLDQIPEILGAEAERRSRQHDARRQVRELLLFVLVLFGARGRRRRDVQLRARPLDRHDERRADGLLPELAAHRALRLDRSARDGADHVTRLQARDLGRGFGIDADDLRAAFDGLEVEPEVRDRHRLVDGEPRVQVRLRGLGVDRRVEAREDLTPEQRGVPGLGGEQGDANGGSDRSPAPAIPKAAANIAPANQIHGFIEVSERSHATMGGANAQQHATIEQQP